MSQKMSFSELVKNSEVPVLVDFWATWCGPCLAMAPVLEQIADTYEGKLKVIKIDVDKNQALAQNFGIQSVPTLLLFKKGEVVWHKIGGTTFSTLKSELQYFV
jgi:thioredoxin 1